MKSKTKEDHLIYTRARNKVKTLVRKNKNLYELNLAQNCKTNPKSIWKYIRSKTTFKENIASLYDNQSVCKSDNQDKAEILADTFEKVFSIDTGSCTPKNTQVELDIVLEDPFINRNDVYKILSKLDESKSPGDDNMHPYFLKETAWEISRPLQLLFNQSTSLGKLPDDWKTARVTAIYKKGNRHVPSNYRPISLTSVICKTLENILRTKLMTFLIGNKLISDKQYGFLPGKSCALQLLNFLDDLTLANDQSKQITTIYLDFEKAFDKISHSALIFKLESMGVSNWLLAWVKDFLSDRTMYVTVGEGKSQKRKVTSGVPQGSVLGPVLFLCYINDLPENVVYSKTLLFADDTKIYIQINSPDDIINLQADINNITKWCTKWQMQLNCNKCKVINFNNNNIQADIILANTPLPVVNSEEDLGVIFDDTLTFESHINKILKKANSMLYLLRRNFNFNDIKIFKLLFTALVRSQIEYSMPVWYPYKISDIKQIESVQRKATKFLPSLKNIPYQQRLKILKLPSIQYRRLRGDMIFLYKLINNRPNFDKLFTLRNETNLGLHESRGHPFTIIHNRCNKNNRKNFFVNRVTNDWNSLTLEIVSAPNINIFKNKLDKFWKEKMYDHAI